MSRLSRVGVCVLWFGACLLPVMAQVSGGGADSTVTSAELHIGAGDLLEITVFDTPELSGKVRVSEKGVASLPLIGQVRLEGLSTDEAQTEIARRLVAGNFVKRPQVSVFVAEYGAEQISILGEVKKPGIYPALGTTKLFDLISLAEGLTPAAGKTVSVIHRAQPDQPELVTLSNDPSLASRANVPLQRGDTIVVHRTGLVYVIGEVVKPGGFPMEAGETITVIQAVALAGGTTRLAKMNGAKLIRKSKGSNQEIALHLKKILASKSADVLVHDADIIYVPGSTGKNAMFRSIDAIVQVAVGTTIYGHW